MTEWRTSTWGDEVSLNYGKAIRGYQERIAPYRVYGTNGPVGWHDEPLANGPGVILGRKGAYRGVHYSRDPFYVIDTAYFVAPKSDLNMRWLYYAVIHHKLGQIDDGSPIPSTTRAAVYVRDLDIPPRPEQDAIAETLGALDDRIEANRRMNGTLEAMARAVFRDWFVDFGPTRRQLAGASDSHAILGGLIEDAGGMAGKVGTGFPSNMPTNNELANRLAPLFPARLGDNGLPEGWEEGTLGDYATLNPKSWTAKRHPEMVEYVDLANTKWGTIETTVTYDWASAPSRARRIVEVGDTIVGTVRPGNGSYAYIGDSGLTASTGFAVLRPNYDKLAAFINCAATSPENIEALASLADGGAYPAVRPDVVLSTPAPVAIGNVAIEFGGIFQVVLDKIEFNKRENRTLAATRDLLLPKLMSGEIRLKDAEGMV